VEERDMLDVFQKYLYQSLRLPEALEAVHIKTALRKDL
jgi:hypothetical protein